MSDCDVHRNVVEVHHAVKQLVKAVVFVAVFVHFTVFVGQVQIVKAAVGVVDRPEIHRKCGEIQPFGDDTDISQLPSPKILKTRGTGLMALTTRFQNIFVLQFVIQKRKY